MRESRERPEAEEDEKGRQRAIQRDVEMKTRRDKKGMAVEGAGVEEDGLLRWGADERHCGAAAAEVDEKGIARFRAQPPMPTRLLPKESNRATPTRHAWQVQSSATKWVIGMEGATAKVSFRGAHWTVHCGKQPGSIRSCPNQQLDGTAPDSDARCQADTIESVCLSLRIGHWQA